MCFYRNRLLQKTLCAYSLLGGLRALLYVLLADLRRRIQSLLVERLAELRTSEYALVPSSESVSKAPAGDGPAVGKLRGIVGRVRRSCWGSRLLMAQRRHV